MLIYANLCFYSSCKLNLRGLAQVIFTDFIYIWFIVQR